MERKNGSSFDGEKNFVSYCWHKNECRLKVTHICQHPWHGHHHSTFHIYILIIFTATLFARWHLFYDEFYDSHCKWHSGPALTISNSIPNEMKLNELLLRKIMAHVTLLLDGMKQEMRFVFRQIGFRMVVACKNEQCSRR